MDGGRGAASGLVALRPRLGKLAMTGDWWRGQPTIDGRPVLGGAPLVGEFLENLMLLVANVQAPRVPWKALHLRAQALSRPGISQI